MANDLTRRTTAWLVFAVLAIIMGALMLWISGAWNLV